MAPEGVEMLPAPAGAAGECPPRPYPPEKNCSLVGAGRFGLAGESGCGKTTLMRVIYRDITPPLRFLSGEVKLSFRGGEEVGSSARTRLGFSIVAKLMTVLWRIPPLSWWG